VRLPPKVPALVADFRADLQQSLAP
jgi:hypothetical protein